jgi:hypothetical protein
MILGMQCDPLCPMLPANRAMAFLKVSTHSIMLRMPPKIPLLFSEAFWIRIGLKAEPKTEFDPSVTAQSFFFRFYSCFILNRKE